MKVLTIIALVALLYAILSDPPPEPIAPWPVSVDRHLCVAAEG